MNTRIVTIAAVMGVTALYTASLGQWLPTGTSTTDAKGRTGSVGIGITNPLAQYKLHVNGNLLVANTFRAEFSSSGTAGAPAITFKDNVTAGIFNSAQNIGITTNGTERMRITQEGIVGIGTTSPTSGYKLDINGKMKVADNNQAIFSGANSVTNPAISFNNDDNTGIFHPTGADIIAIATAGQERMRINDQGRVGIGTTNPGNGSLTLGNIPALGSAASLFLVSNNGLISSRTAAQVLSDIGAGGGGGAHGVTTGYVPYANGPTTWATSPMAISAGHVGIGVSNPMYNTLEVTSDASTMNTVSIANFHGGTALLAQSTGGGATMTVANNSGSNALAAQFYGNVQISSGSLKVNDWTIEAPDYVFEKGYKLPSLKSVEKHIAANKHLPDVPSASEMKKNGVDLSQMNMTLLKKVEELTLYVIDQNKQIMEQNKKIEALEKKIAVK